MATNLQSPLHDKKDELLELITQAFHTVGLDDFDISSIRLRVSNRGRICPPGQTAVWEPIEHPNGSVTYQWVCRRS
jgi:hypothetical protein